MRRPLLAYDKWRRDGWRPGAWLAPLLVAAALLTADMGIATVGFLLAYALCLDQGSLARRLARLLPYVLVVVVWQLAYRAGGHGVNAPGFGYLHPLEQPLAYATQLVETAPMLALGQLTPVAADFWGALPPAGKVVFFVLAVAILVALAKVVWPRLAARPEARFWLLGAGLSIVPAAASGPSDTNLVFVSFGAAAALAMALGSFVDEPPVAKWPRFLVGALAVFNLGLAPLLLPAKCMMMLAINTMGNQTNASIPRHPTVASKTMVVVSVASDGHLYYVRKRRDVERVPHPARTRILATSAAQVAVTRLDAVTVRVHQESGFFASAMQRMYLDPKRPLRQGDVIELADLAVSVGELTKDGRPKTVDFRFAAPLESPRWLWMRGEGLRLVGWAPPKVGQTVVVPASM